MSGSRLRLFLLLAVLLTALSMSCTKEHEGRVVPGTINLEISAVHHSWGVPYVPVHLKMNTREFPGEDSTSYDFHGLCDNEGKVRFEQLYPGDYFVYIKGYDMIWGDTVTGKAALQLQQPAVNVTVRVSE